MFLKCLDLHKLDFMWSLWVLLYSWRTIFSLQGQSLCWTGADNIIDDLLTLVPLISCLISMSPLWSHHAVNQSGQDLQLRDNELRLQCEVSAAYLRNNETSDSLPLLWGWGGVETYSAALWATSRSKICRDLSPTGGGGVEICSVVVWGV